MSRRSAPGLGQWLLVIAMVALVLFLLFKLYQYGTFRSYFPAGLTAGGVPIGGLTSEEAAEQRPSGSRFARWISNSRLT